MLLIIFPSGKCIIYYNESNTVSSSCSFHLQSRHSVRLLNDVTAIMCTSVSSSYKCTDLTLSVFNIVTPQCFPPPNCPHRRLINTDIETGSGWLWLMRAAGLSAHYPLKRNESWLISHASFQCHSEKCFDGVNIGRTY